MSGPADPDESDASLPASEVTPAVPVRRVGPRRVQWRPPVEDDAARAGDRLGEAAAERLSGTAGEGEPSDDSVHDGTVHDGSAARDAWLHAQRPPHWE